MFHLNIKYREFCANYWIQTPVKQECVSIINIFIITVSIKQTVDT